MLYQTHGLSHDHGKTQGQRQLFFLDRRRAWVYSDRHRRLVELILVTKLNELVPSRKEEVETIPPLNSSVEHLPSGFVCRSW